MTRAATVAHRFVDVVPDSPSWGFQRAAISTDEAHYEMKTPRQWAGFGYGKVIDRSLAPGFDMFYTIKLPLWIVAAVFLALPAGRTVSTLRQLRRRARGLCPCCGYDLRASEGRCPECGTPIPAEVPP